MNTLVSANCAYSHSHQAAPFTHTSSSTTATVCHPGLKSTESWPLSERTTVLFLWSYRSFFLCKFCGVLSCHLNKRHVSRHDNVSDLSCISKNNVTFKVTIKLSIFIFIFYLWNIRFFSPATSISCRPQVWLISLNQVKLYISVSQFKTADSLIYRFTDLLLVLDCSLLLHWCILINMLKEIVHPKIKITPWFTHPQAIHGVYDFLLSDKYNPSYIKNVLASLSFIMAFWASKARPPFTAIIKL